MSPTDGTVNVNTESELYVITAADGAVGYLSFDDCTYDIGGYGIELVGRGKLPAEFIDAPVVVPRGSLAAYNTLRVLRDELIGACAEQGASPIAGLTNQLHDLEGYPVVVMEGAKQRAFVVGVSDDPIPRHLEVTSSGSVYARREYDAVHLECRCGERISEYEAADDCPRCGDAINRE